MATKTLLTAPPPESISKEAYLVSKPKTTFGSTDSSSTPHRGLPGGGLPPPGSWYNPNIGLTASTDPLSFARLANSLLPYLSTQDQLSVATFLNTQDPTGLFKSYLGQTPTNPAARVENTADTFSSAERAKKALAALEAQRTAANLTDEQLGSGYKLLKEMIGMLASIGVNPAAGEQGMTRAEYEALQAKVDALNSQAMSDKTLAPYAELATKFINPTMIGTLFPTSTSGGHTIYGRSNKQLFT